MLLLSHMLLLLAVVVVTVAADGNCSCPSFCPTNLACSASVQDCNSRTYSTNQHQNINHISSRDRALPHHYYRHHRYCHHHDCHHP
jgi:hypothetical protein